MTMQINNKSKISKSVVYPLSWVLIYILHSYYKGNAAIFIKLMETYQQNYRITVYRNFSVNIREPQI